MAKSITFEAYHYQGVGVGLRRARSERQDLTFRLEGDVVVVYAPPPIGAVLYVDAPSAMFLELLKKHLQ